MGKVIYQPSGKAGEYSDWACNLYLGCTNQCSYCYLRFGPMSGTLGGTTPALKKGLENPDMAFSVFCSELEKYAPSITGSLFFTFTSDPCLPETIDLNMRCITEAMRRGVPCILLTKRADFLDSGAWTKMLESGTNSRVLLKVGFTLTGRDDLEPFASTNAERLVTMRTLHEDGFQTWASIEPVMDLTASYNMIASSREFCQAYKIGLPSGCHIPYSKDECREFVRAVLTIIPGSIIYWKEDLKEFCK